MNRDLTPWRAWLNTAATCGISPREFWRLSVAEWRALVTPQHGAALDRAGFDALAAAFPDHS